jgi:hypothetical protein
MSVDDVMARGRASDKGLRSRRISAQFMAMVDVNGEALFGIRHGARTSLKRPS